MARTKPYKALTTINLPLTGRQFRPGEKIEMSDLEEAQQGEEEIQALVAGGALGEEKDELHPSTIIPDPAMPTIQSVVAQAQQAVQELEESGAEIPEELRAVAGLDYQAVTADDEGASGESTS
jgi:hypothetical protein